MRSCSGAQTLSLLCLLGLLCCGLSYPTFSEYVVQFGKSYDASEYAMREAIYTQTLSSFAQITSFVPNVNKFSDWTPEELKALRTLRLLPESERIIVDEEEDGSNRPRLGSPESLDWRDQSIVTSVKDQSSCGACWAFATTSMLESLLIQKKYTLNTSVDLSEEYLIKCTSQSSCSGGFFEYAMDLAVKTGLPQESQFPYALGTTNSAGICLATGTKVNATRQSFYSSSDAKLIDLLQQGPVGVGITTTVSGFTSYGSGTMECVNPSSNDHAVVVVGYTPTSYIIKNSWGRSWGVDGFGYISRASNRNCRILDQVHSFKAIQRHYLFSLLAFIAFLALLA